MLKRIFCPGLFPAEIIADVLSQDVAAYVDSSALSLLEPDDLRESDTLETAVAGCCQKMSFLIDVPFDGIDKNYIETYWSLLTRCFFLIARKEHFIYILHEKVLSADSIQASALLAEVASWAF